MCIFFYMSVSDLVYRCMLIPILQFANIGSDTDIILVSVQPYYIGTCGFSFHIDKTAKDHQMYFSRLLIPKSVKHIAI